MVDFWRYPVLSADGSTDYLASSAEAIINALGALLYVGPLVPSEAGRLFSPEVMEELLAEVPLFAKLSRRDLGRLVKAGHEVTYPPGTELTSDAESGVCFFVIAEGEARVDVKGTEVRRLGPGRYFGEMALIDRSPRSATVTAVTDVRCFVMTQWQFRPFATEHPEVAWALLEAMVQRVREAESRTAPAE